ncbi:sigma-70 family RNA polymerase sigma factor [Aeromicrobium sp. CF4.19]|uniref:sigma-70 family RNA polymerase sigma factor n=1 Tax=Aeromicrobium sp. CF4.19 TaxID=3373082 RepID=UPI003EE46F0F
MADELSLVEVFQAHRERLTAIATRVLGSRADAEDAVQETWVRLSRQDVAAIDNVAGWLTTVVGRICIDALRSRSAKAETSYGDVFADVVVTEDDVTPEASAELTDSVGVALLVVLGSLRPDERLAFVLHDVFAVTFAEIAEILGRSADASKMLASRARQKVQGVPRPTGGHQEQGAVVDAFLAAARDGDFEALLDVLHPDLTWQLHTPHGIRVETGAAGVVDAVRRGDRTKVVARRVLVNGEPGILAWVSGKPVSVMACTVQDGRMIGIVSLLHPARLAPMHLPGPEPAS